MREFTRDTPSARANANPRVSRRARARIIGPSGRGRGRGRIASHRIASDVPRTTAFFGAARAWRGGAMRVAPIVAFALSVNIVAAA